jgi:DNA polymerase-3 subunit delta'
LIILTTSQPSNLPITVLSRCQKIRFGRLSETEVAQALKTISACDASQIRLVSRLAQGNLDRARELLRDDVAGRRSATLSMLTTALSGNLLSVLKSAEMLGKSKHRSISEENLETLQIWYRDLLLLLEGKEEHLINQDLKPQLGQMAAQYDWPGVLRSLHLIEDTRRALEFNVNLELAWMVLLFKLKRLRRVRT